MMSCSKKHKRPLCSLCTVFGQKISEKILIEVGFSYLLSPCLLGVLFSKVLKEIFNFVTLEFSIHGTAFQNLLEQFVVQNWRAEELLH